MSFPDKKASLIMRAMIACLLLVAPAMAGTLRFSANNYVTAGNVLQWENTQAWSFGCPIKTQNKPTTDGAAIIFSNADASPYPCYEFWVNDAGRLAVRVISNFPTNYLGAYGGTDVCDGLPHYVWATYDGSKAASGVKLYVDGVLETMTTEADTLTGSSVNTNPLYIGNQKTAGLIATFNFDYMGPIRLSDVVRNEAYIAQYSDYKTGTLPPLDADTVLAYNWTEGTGTSANDLSASGYDGTLSDASLWSTFVFPLTGPIRQHQFKSGSHGDSTAALDLVFTSNVTAGRYVIVGVATYNASITVTVTDSQGNTYTQAGTYASGSNNRCSIWYTVASSTGALTVSVTPNATAYVSAGAGEYSGIAASSPVEATSTGTGTSATPSSGSVTVSGAGRMVFAVAGQASNITNMLAGTEFVLRARISGSGIENAGVEDFIGAGSSIAATFTFNSAAWAAVGASFVPLINTDPVATITSSDPQTATEGDEVTLTGTGTDAEDGTLTGASLVWTSDLDGALGTGVSLTVDDLSVGEHTITLSVTDSGSLTGTDTCTVTIEALPSLTVDQVKSGVKYKVGSTIYTGEYAAAGVGGSAGKGGGKQ